MKERRWMHQHPVFGFNEAARHFASRAYAKLFISRQLKKGLIKRVGKGRYSASQDIFAIASNIVYPSYISFISASYLYGITQQIPRIVYVATGRRRKGVECMGYGIEFVPVGEVWGYHKERHGESEVFVADIEKLMIDAFARPKCMGNFYEVEMVFSQAPEIDTNKLREYLKKCGSNRIYRQVGYMLQKHKGIDLSGLAGIDRNYHALNPFGRGGKIERKWRLLV